MKGKLKQCCSCEKVFYNFAKPSKDCLCPHCKSGNWVYGYIDEQKKCPKCDGEMRDKIMGDICIECGYLDENLKCEVCGKSDKDVRFEGMTETNICDSCLYKEKNKNE